MSAELNARIGKTSPAWWTEPTSTTPGLAGSRAATVTRKVPRALWLLSALLAALWPHWIYVARRLVDGSDEPWGILALVTVVALLARDRRELAVPTRSALVASALLALVAALASLLLPDLAAAALAMLALGLYLVHALPRRPATPLIALLLLALPVIASLQFYLGYPLRVLAAHASAMLLSSFGIASRAAGAAIIHDGGIVLVDAPCAGIGMLWVGSYAAALLSYLERAGALHTVLHAAAAALLVLAANIARNTVLFFPEAGLVQWPAWAHDAIGLAAFATAIAPLVWLTSLKSTTAR
jgi:exosortase/archaeosortase family protein